MIETIRITAKTSVGQTATIEVIERGERVALYFGMHQELFDTATFLKVCELLLAAMDKEKEA